MAHYYNIVDTGVPIMVDDVEQYCTVDGQSIQFVVQDINSCVNGGTRLVTYTPATQNSDHIFTQAVGGQLQPQIAPRQNVYIINTEEQVSLPADHLKPQQHVHTPETSNFILTNTKDPNDPQVQWLAVETPKMSRPHKADQGPSKRPAKPKSSTVPRAKIPCPRPSPRPPLHAEKSPKLTPNRNLQTLGNQPPAFLSERIKQARMSSSKTPPPQKSLVTPQKPEIPQKANVTPQKSLNPKGKVPTQKLQCPQKMETDVQSTLEQQYDHEAGSESIAYLQQTITNPQQTIVQHQITGNTVKMLVVLPTGEQRLITFDIPNEDCTVQDLLEQANIPPNGETTVSLVKDPILNINYIVESGEGGIIQMTDTPESPDDTTDRPSDPPDEGSSSTPVNEEPRFVDNKLAVCPYCGINSMDFNRCFRCRRKLPEDVKAIPMTPTTNQQTKDTLKSIDSYYHEKQTPQTAKDAKKPKTKIQKPAKAKAAVKEPECLTLSSDDEDESPHKKAKKAEAKRTQLINRLHQPSEESDMISDKEPIITNSLDDSLNSEKSLDGTGHNGDDRSVDEFKQTLLCCRTVRVGSYKYIPHEKVLINHTGLILSVPLLEDDKKTVTITVKIQSIVKVLIHFGKSMPVLFFYTNTKVADYIRGVLGMQDPIGPYYDPASKDHTHKRITLLPDKISDESKIMLKHLFGHNNLLEELNSKEANDILVRASPKDNLASGNRRGSTGPGANGVVEKITVYPPPPAKGGIALNTEDYSCLGEDQFLNDAIIDFYLKYLTLEVLSDVDQQRTHVFSSYFYKRLTSPNAGGDSSGLSPAAKRHARVQKWTKNVNIFDKDFIVIPINEHAHWFLAIICFPGLVGVVTPPKAPERPKQKKKISKEVKLQSVTIGSTTITPVTTTITIDQVDDQSERDEAEGDEDELENESDDDDEETKPEDNKLETKVKIKEEIKQEIKQEIKEEPEEIKKIPCILIFDSLAGPGRARVVATLRDYLSCEYQAKMGKEKVFSKDTIKGACPKVPQQSNFTDCGLYVLQYAEAFFSDPIRDYTLPIKTLKNWFEEIVVTRKREELSKLVVKLMLNTKGEKNINLPVVQFPTMDGKLRPKPENEKVKEETKKEEEIKTEKEPGEVVTKTATVYRFVPAIVTADGNVEINVDKPKLSPGNTMSFLRTKRIPRLMLRESSSPAGEVAAKKHKGDNDSCK